MMKTTISRTEMRSILKQAKREAEAEKAGFVCHAEMVAAHRAARTAKLRAEREARREALLARRDRLRSQATV